MNYTAPKAELVSIESNSVILGSIGFCIIYSENNPEATSGNDNKLPDYYNNN